MDVWEVNNGSDIPMEDFYGKKYREKKKNVHVKFKKFGEGV